MTVQEYLPRLNNKITYVTFLVAKAVKDEYTPFYHAEYKTTPLYSTYEFKNAPAYKNYIILNDNANSIDWLSGANWNTLIKHGTAKCMVVIDEEDLKILHPDAKQRRQMINFIDDVIVGVIK